MIANLTRYKTVLPPGRVTSVEVIYHFAMTERERDFTIVDIIVNTRGKVGRGGEIPFT